jgi:hypothetical protein
MTHRDRSIGLGELRELLFRGGQRSLLGLPFGPRSGESKLVADAQPHLGARCSRPLSENPGHPGQHVLGRIRASHPLGELREDLVGRRSLPVDDAVGQTPGALAKGLERDRDDSGRCDGERNVRLPCRPDRRADPHHDREVDGGDEGGKHCDDDGLVDNDVDVVQPVLEHGDADRGRDHQDRDPGEDVTADVEQGAVRDDGHNGERAGVGEPFELRALVTRRAAESDDEGDGRGDPEDEQEQDPRNLEVVGHLESSR